MRSIKIGKEESKKKKGDELEKNNYFLKMHKKSIRRKK